MKKLFTKAAAVVFLGGAALALYFAARVDRKTAGDHANVEVRPGESSGDDSPFRQSSSGAQRSGIKNRGDSGKVSNDGVLSEHGSGGSLLGTKNVQEIIAKDVEEGINAEARAKEARLRQLAGGLAVGMDARQVTNLLGRPDTARKRLTEGWEYQWVDVLSSTNLIEAKDTFFGYWPRIGVPFNGKNGQGYEVLHVRFDTNGRVSTWKWAPTTVFTMGSIKRTREQKQYWEGIHALSGPPPLEWPADF